MFFGFGQPESTRPELINIKLPSTSIDTGHKAVVILILPYMSSLKIRPMPRLVLRRLKAVTDASYNPVSRMQSLSLQTAILKSRLVKISRGRIAFADARPERAKMAEQGGAAVKMPQATKTFRAVWNLAAVHKPLHATRKAPTIKPGLHELGAREIPLMLVDKTQGAIGASANSSGNVEDVIALP